WHFACQPDFRNAASTIRRPKRRLYAGRPLPAGPKRKRNGFTRVKTSSGAWSTGQVAFRAAGSTETSVSLPGMPRRDETRVRRSPRRETLPGSGPGRSTTRTRTWRSDTWPVRRRPFASGDRKSTRLNSSHITISYAVFCLKKKKKQKKNSQHNKKKKYKNKTNITTKKK